jgi:hypothetical protein
MERRTRSKEYAAMEEKPETDPKAAESTDQDKPWQFSLRTIFILTTLSAAYFSIAAQFRPVLIIS